MAFMAAAAPIISGVAGIAGAGVGALGAATQGEAQAAEARYQSQIARNDQIIAEQNAGYATQAGETATYDVGLRERAAAGRITSGIAANNIDVNTGSAARVRATQTEMGQLAEERTMASANLTAYGYRTQATSFGAQAQLEKAEAPLDVAGGFLGATGAVLAGASNIPFKWSAMQNTPVGGGALTPMSTVPNYSGSGAY
jgi:hypothetical protein